MSSSERYPSHQKRRVTSSPHTKAGYLSFLEPSLSLYTYRIARYTVHQNKSQISHKTITLQLRISKTTLLDCRLSPRITYVYFCRMYVKCHRRPSSGFGHRLYSLIYLHFAVFWMFLRNVEVKTTVPHDLKTDKTYHLIIPAAKAWSILKLINSARWMVGLCRLHTKLTLTVRRNKTCTFHIVCAKDAYRSFVILYPMLFFMSVCCRLQYTVDTMNRQWQLHEGINYNIAAHEHEGYYNA